MHAICLHLGEYCSGCKVGGIAFKAEATGLGGEGEDGGGGDELVEHIWRSTDYNDAVVKAL